MLRVRLSSWGCAGQRGRKLSQVAGAPAAALSVSCRISGSPSVFVPSSCHGGTTQAPLKQRSPQQQRQQPTLCDRTCMSVTTCCQAGCGGAGRLVSLCRNSSTLLHTAGSAETGSRLASCTSWTASLHKPTKVKLLLMVACKPKEGDDCVLQAVLLQARTVARRSSSLAQKAQKANGKPPA